MTQFYNEKSANFRIYIQLPVSGCDCSLFLVNNPSGDLTLSARMCVRECEGATESEKSNTMQCLLNCSMYILYLSRSSTSITYYTFPRHTGLLKCKMCHTPCSNWLVEIFSSDRNDFLSSVSTCLAEFSRTPPPALLH